MVEAKLNVRIKKRSIWKTSKIKKKTYSEKKRKKRINWE
tara:strand:- start:59 stop:175 length:117 start_codon:yes stop_codon:yes gene_type:complete